MKTHLFSCASAQHQVSQPVVRQIAIAEIHKLMHLCDGRLLNSPSSTALCTFLIQLILSPEPHFSFSEATFVRILIATQAGEDQPLRETLLMLSEI